ncbi:MAG TPA: hypothetical protein VF787_03420 [Thermoanaerobaculia bacterium]
MARVVITVTDNPIDGTVSIVTDPPMQSLLDRKRAFGIKSLSAGEIYSVIAVQHVAEHATSQVPQDRAEKSRLILPGNFS